MNQCTKPDALQTQVGGDHYSKTKIQPIEFVMANRWDACAFSILKYVSRHRDKNGLQDLQKARHFVDLRQALVEYLRTDKATECIEVTGYCQANGLGPAETQILVSLNDWLHLDQDRFRLQLIVALENLMRDCYVKPPAAEEEPFDSYWAEGRHE